MQLKPVLWYWILILVSGCPWQFIKISITTTQYHTNFLCIWSSHLKKLLIQYSSHRTCSSWLNDKLHSLKYLPIDIHNCKINFIGINLTYSKWISLHVHVLQAIINPRHMHRRVTVVVLCVCLSVCLSELSKCYIHISFASLKLGIIYGVSNACIVWILLKMLCSPVLVTFAQDRYLPP